MNTNTAYHSIYGVSISPLLANRRKILVYFQGHIFTECRCDNYMQKNLTQCSTMESFFECQNC